LIGVVLFQEDLWFILCLLGLDPAEILGCDSSGSCDFVPDLDADEDGTAESVSVGLLFGAQPVTVLGALSD
jgi:hypothetical protein